MLKQTCGFVYILCYKEGGGPCGVMYKVLDCSHEVSEFEPQLSYVQFRANTIWKGMTPLAMDEIVELFSFKDGIGISSVDMSLNKYIMSYEVDKDFEKFIRIFNTPVPSYNVLSFKEFLSVLKFYFLSV